MLQPVGHVQQKISNAATQTPTLSPEGYESLGSTAKEDIRLPDETSGKGSGRGKNKRRYFAARRKRIVEKICRVSKQVLNS